MIGLVEPHRGDASTLELLADGGEVFPVLRDAQFVLILNVFVVKHDPSAGSKGHGVILALVLQVLPDAGVNIGQFLIGQFVAALQRHVVQRQDEAVLYVLGHRDIGDLAHGGQSSGFGRRQQLLLEVVVTPLGRTDHFVLLLALVEISDVGLQRLFVDPVIRYQNVILVRPLLLVPPPGVLDEPLPTLHPARITAAAKVAATVKNRRNFMLFPPRIIHRFNYIISIRCRIGFATENASRYRK